MDILAIILTAWNLICSAVGGWVIGYKGTTWLLERFRGR